MLAQVIGGVVFYAVYSSIVTISTNHHGFVTRYGKVIDVLDPGLNYVFPIITHVEEVKTGFDTDWTTDVTCVSRDNINVVIPNIYIDNEFNCKSVDSASKESVSKDCMTKQYSMYYMQSDAKFKAKQSRETAFIPENGIIFKYLPEVLAPYCKQLNAYQMRTSEWYKMFPDILISLQKKVGTNVKIHAIRLDNPVFDKMEYRVSLPAVFSTWIYNIFI